MRGKRLTRHTLVLHEQTSDDRVVEAVPLRVLREGDAAVSRLAAVPHLQDKDPARAMQRGFTVWNPGLYTTQLPRPPLRQSGCTRTDAETTRGHPVPRFILEGRTD
jgi:hypothetical protein